MKSLYLSACFQLSSLARKPLYLLAASVLLLAADAIGQKSSDEQFSNPESVQSFLPGTLVNWTVKIDKNKVVLGWTTTIEANALHFTIQKSFDGVDYKDAGVLHAAGNSNSRKQYAFVERLSNNANKNIYYRLKMVDFDSNVKYSDVRSVRSNSQEQTNVEIYPNPAVDQLRVTVAASWVNQKVLIQVYNANGIVVKTKGSESARETELIPVNDLARGLYVLKVSSGGSSSALRFIKK